MPNTVNSYMVTDLGNVSLNPRGEYNTTYKYEYLDLIHYKGGSYVCLAPLGDTISGISPVDGSTTTYWQCIAIPGEITQEYKDMYNEVINDANKVEELKNSIDTIELSIKDSETNAKTSETNAKASETNAKTSETKSKENLNSAIQSNSETKNMIIGFDQHVSDTISNSTTTINDLTNSAISSVVEQQNKSLNYIKNQADAYINSEEIIIRADLHQIIDDFNNSTNSKKQEIINSANDKINTMTTIYDNTVDAKNTAETASTTAFEKANEATTSADEAKTSSDEARTNAELVAADKAIVAADKTEIGGMKSAIESSVAKFESDLETYNIPTMNNDINALKSDLTELENIIFHDISIVKGRRGLNGTSSIQESSIWCTTDIFELKTGDCFVFDESFVISQLVTIINGRISSTSADITSGKIDIPTDGTYAVNMFRVDSFEFTDSDIDYLNKTFKVYTNIVEKIEINTQEIAIAKEEIDTVLHELQLETVTENIQFSVGRWLVGGTSINTSKTKYASSGAISLKNGDVLKFSGTYYKYEILLFDGDIPKTILVNEYTEPTYVIEQNGKYVINAFSVHVADFDDAKITDITQSTFVMYNNSVINEIQNPKYVIDVNYMIYSYQGMNKKFFHTESFFSENEIIFDFNGTYGELKLLNNTSGVSVDITKRMLVNGGKYQIYGYAKPIADVTEEKLAEIKADIVITTTKSKYDFGLPKSEVSHTPKLIPYMEENTQKLMPVFCDDYEKPLYPVWGHEYLEHWYEKVYEGSDSAKVVLDGDSITQGYDSHMEGVNDAFMNMRGYAIKKIMKVGNFPMDKLTVVNNGYGGRKTGEWVGDPVYGASSYVSQYPNGFLDVAMSNNPDLLIVAWGMNDADKNNTELQGLTTEGRLEVFKNHMIEGLERIRGNTPVNNRPAYNKSVYDLSIVLCMPTVGGSESSGRGNFLWNQYIREILMELCRKYHCAFADLTFRTYAHNSMSPRIWSCLTSTGGRDGIHPNKYSNAQTMSMLQDLIYPICMWNVDASDF